ncbi:alpha/beta hydrolase [uncultured Sneathiella sp.]|uniref:alpha/beta hydrolase n=1 Tax=uncultured Sneathiella sp. TaxID=879315 RepID=UPI0025936AA6|nr:alpha/beta hydrolase [uncultured Sneathiella sp.]
MTLSRKIALWLCALIMLFGVIPFTGIYFAQGAFVFPVPDRGAGEAAGGFAPVTITTADGERLNAFYHPPGDKAASILVFHGNAETAANQMTRGQALATAGYGVLLAEYRGYGGSTGEPSEAGVITDGLASYDFLVAETEGPVGIFAHSLGTGAAIPVAAARDPFAVVLESPFTSLLAIARYRVRLMPPFDFLLRYPFRNEARIGEVRAPILIIHGTEDKVIPFEEGEKLATLAPKGTAFIKIEGAGHNNLGQYDDIKMATSFFTKALAANP